MCMCCVRVCVVCFNKKPSNFEWIMLCGAMKQSLDFKKTLLFTKYSSSNLWATLLPWAAAFSSHSRAVHEHRSTPSPFRYIWPKSIYATPLPCSALRRYNGIASVKFWETPRPYWYRTPRLFWATSMPWITLFSYHAAANFYFSLEPHLDWTGQMRPTALRWACTGVPRHLGQSIVVFQWWSLCHKCFGFHRDSTNIAL